MGPGAPRGDAAGAADGSAGDAAGRAHHDTAAVLVRIVGMASASSRHHSAETGYPRIQLPHRPMLLWAGPLSAATTSFDPPPDDQRASLWWPEDRAWCVPTDVDLMTTYVGGGPECIDALVTDDELEAMPVSIDQPVTWDSDQLNPLQPCPRA